MTFLSDTTPEAEAVLFDLLRKKSVGEKLQMVMELNEMVRQLAISGIRQRHGDIDDKLVNRLLADITLGPELAEKVYGPLPEGVRP